MIDVRSRISATVITISYNQASFLERAIRSVLSQGYVQYIVIDAGSTDGSREIIEHFRPRLSHVIFENDDGPADGLNKGLAFATGTIVGVLNADDAYLPGAVTDALLAFQKAPDAAVAYANGFIVDAEGNVLRRFRSSAFGLRRYAYGAVSIMHQATFVRREAMQAAGGFNVRNRTCWDGELLVDLRLASMRFVHVDRDWGIFTLHRDSISGSRRLQDRYRADRDRIFEKIMGRPPGLIDAPIVWGTRLLKWTLDPIGFAGRLREVVVGPPSLTVLQSPDGVRLVEGKMPPS